MRYLLNFLLWSPKRLGLVILVLVVMVVLISHLVSFLSHL